MSDPKPMPLPMEGSCRCGATKVKLSAPPLSTFACHCTGCQKMTGSAFSLAAGIPTAGFAVIQGEPVQGGLKGEAVKHYFCPSCLTWMYTSLPSIPYMTSVRCTILDKTDWLGTPWMETFTSEKLPWVHLGTKYSFDKFPPDGEAGPVFQSYKEAVEKAGT